MWEKSQHLYLYEMMESELSGWTRSIDAHF